MERKQISQVFDARSRIELYIQWTTQNQPMSNEYVVPYKTMNKNKMFVWCDAKSTKDEMVQPKIHYDSLIWFLFQNYSERKNTEIEMTWPTFRIIRNK